MEPATLLVFAVSLIGTAGVQITDLRVPHDVQNGSSHTVLDCVYTIKPEELEKDRGLVVKWYFNNGPMPVYQWIPGMKPQDLGILRGRLNLSHRATDHRATMHRALYIVNPTTELSGDYKCCVSTFKDEDFMTKKMVVYATEKRFELLYKKLDVDTVKVVCSAKDLYPEPKMALFPGPDGTKIAVPDAHVETIAKQGAYDIKASVTLLADDLNAPTSFDCEIRIPEVRYAVRKTVVYYPGMHLFSSAGVALLPICLTSGVTLLVLFAATLLLGTC